jgi:hypothetical protein
MSVQLAVVVFDVIETLCMSATGSYQPFRDVAVVR